MTRYTSKCDSTYRGEIMTLYIKTTRDKYELIKDMAYSVQELAERTGTKEKTIFKGLERFKKGEKCQWQIVEIE